MEKITIWILLGILLVVIILSAPTTLKVVSETPLFSFAETQQSFTFTFTKDSSSAYALGDELFRHISHDNNKVVFSFGDTTYEAELGQSIKLNPLFSVTPYVDIVAVLGKDEYVDHYYMRYIFDIEDVDVINVKIVDVQQKLIDGGTSRLEICNSAGMSLVGGITLVEEYDNQEVITTDHKVTFTEGCKIYEIPLTTKYLSPVNTKYHLYISIKEVLPGTITEFIDTQFKCKTSSGYIYWSSNPCPSGQEILDVREGEGFTVNVDERKRTFFDSNTYAFRYSIVTEIKERTSIDCSETSCPEGFVCDHATVDGEDYYVCNKDGLVDSFTKKTEAKTLEEKDGEITLKERPNYFPYIIIGAVIILIILFKKRK